MFAMCWPWSKRIRNGSLRSSCLGTVESVNETVLLESEQEIGDRVTSWVNDVQQRFDTGETANSGYGRERLKEIRTCWVCWSETGNPNIFHPYEYQYDHEKMNSLRSAMKALRELRGEAEFNFENYPSYEGLEAELDAEKDHLLIEEIRAEKRRFGDGLANALTAELEKREKSRDADWERECMAFSSERVVKSFDSEEKANDKMVGAHEEQSNEIAAVVGTKSDNDQVMTHTVGGGEQEMVAIILNDSNQPDQQDLLVNAMGGFEIIAVTTVHKDPPHNDSICLDSNVDELSNQEGETMDIEVGSEPEANELSTANNEELQVHSEHQGHCEPEVDN